MWNLFELQLYKLEDACTGETSGHCKVYNIILFLTGYWLVYILVH